MIFKVESFTVRVVNVEGKTLYINELFFLCSQVLGTENTECLKRNLLSCQCQCITVGKCSEVYWS